MSKLRDARYRHTEYYLNRLRELDDAYLPLAYYERLLETALVFRHREAEAAVLGNLRCTIQDYAVEYRVTGNVAVKEDVLAELAQRQGRSSLPPTNERLRNYHPPD